MSPTVGGAWCGWREGRVRQSEPDAVAACRSVHPDHDATGESNRMTPFPIASDPGGSRPERHL